MTEQTSTPASTSAFGPPPAMPSIWGSAVLEAGEVLALTRRTLGLLLGRA